MRVFFDTEFIDSITTTQLVSLGAVREDGAEFYAEAKGVDWSRADRWVMLNVSPYLSGPQLELPDLRGAFYNFAASATEFWAWYGAYDWMLVCQLFGGFMQLPRMWPHYFHDLETLRLLRGGVLPKQQGRLHHALEDARWNRKAYLALMR